MVQILIVRIAAVAVVVPADGIVITDDGLPLIDIALEIRSNPHAGVRCAFRNLMKHLVSVGDVGGVEVGQTAIFIAPQMVVQPVLERKQALLRVGRDGAKLHNPVTHGIVIKAVS